MVSLAAGRNAEAAFEQARRWKPRLVSISTAVDAEIFRSHLQTAGVQGIEVVHGSAGTSRRPLIRRRISWSAQSVGVAGLEATYAAVKAGKTVGLANKECLVAAGELITP